MIVESKGAVREITINRPKALNALNSATLRELEEAFRGMASDARVVIITGSGEKAFVAGADISEMADCDAAQGREFARLGQSVFSKIEKCPQIVIAAVNGFALGGGCELALSCDIRLASFNAKFAQPEVGLGITPGFGGTQRLPRLIGKGPAKEMIFTCEMIDAHEAFRIGLVNKIFEQADLMNEARKLAEKILSKSFRAVSMSKLAINAGLNMDDESAFLYEAEIFGMCFSAQDQKEGMKAFLNKKPPKFL
ncbi:MAG: enoyl-CoA hydratase/isomerase family protein [Synergistaceae bacterium]|nr:enoyl-CoA hydratase/isomerase family protein [Synergistaceae bacterium]